MAVIWALLALLQVAPDAAASTPQATPPPAPIGPAGTPPPATGAPPAPVPVAKKKRPIKRKPLPPPLMLFHTNRGETLVLQADAASHFPTGTFKRFNRFMRCHHTNRQHAMSPLLLRMLAQISRHYGGRRLLVVAGYRAPQAARNPKSPHKRGLAADLRVDGVANADLRDFCRKTFQHAGVGYYPNSSFVHIDVRKGAGAFWIDYSGPGDAPLYSRTPDSDLQTGRAETFKPGQSGEGEGEGEVPAEGANPLPAWTTGGSSPQAQPAPPK